MWDQMSLKAMGVPKTYGGPMSLKTDGDPMSLTCNTIIKNLTHRLGLGWHVRKGTLHSGYLFKQLIFNVSQNIAENLSEP